MLSLIALLKNKIKVSLKLVEKMCNNIPNKYKTVKNDKKQTTSNLNNSKYKSLLNVCFQGWPLVILVLFN